MRRAAGLVIPLLLAIAPAASARTTALDALRADVPVAAYGTTVAWSAYDPATKVYRLRLRHAGEVSTPDVGPRPVPFDVDVGPGSGGRVLVYSRCDSDAMGAIRTEGCDLFAYSVSGESEERIAGASTSGADERLPAISGDRLAFTRTAPGSAPEVMVRQGGRSRTLPGAPTRFCLGGQCQDTVDRRVTRLDLSGRRLGLVTTYATSGFEGAVSEVRLVSAVTGMSQRVTRAASSADTTIRYVGLGFDARNLYVGAACSGEAAGCLQRHGIFRYRLLDRALNRAEVSRRLNAFSWAGDRAVLVTDPASGDCGDRRCALVTRTGLRFVPAKRPL